MPPWHRESSYPRRDSDSNHPRRRYQREGELDPFGEVISHRDAGMLALRKAHGALEHTRRYGNPALGLLPTSAPKASAHHAAAHAAKRVRDSAKVEAVKRLRKAGMSASEVTEELIDAILAEHQEGLEVMRKEGKAGSRKFGVGTEKDNSYKRTRTGKQLAEYREQNHWEKVATAEARMADQRRDRVAQSRGFVSGENALPYAASHTPASDRAYQMLNSKRYMAPPVAYNPAVHGVLQLGYNPTITANQYRPYEVKSARKHGLKHAQGQHVKFN